jgi:hypothetical protein
MEGRNLESVEDIIAPDPNVPVGSTREVELDSGYGGVQVPTGDILAASQTVDTDERIVEFGK